MAAEEADVDGQHGPRHDPEPERAMHARAVDSLPKLPVEERRRFRRRERRRRRQRSTSGGAIRLGLVQFQRLNPIDKIQRKRGHLDVKVK